MGIRLNDLSPRRHPRQANRGRRLLPALWPGSVRPGPGESSRERESGRWLAHFSRSRVLSAVPLSQFALQAGDGGHSQRLALDALELVHAATVRHLSTSPGVPAQGSHNAAAPISGWPRRTH